MSSCIIDAPNPDSGDWLPFDAWWWEVNWRIWHLFLSGGPYAEWKMHHNYWSTSRWLALTMSRASHLGCQCRQSWLTQWYLSFAEKKIFFKDKQWHVITCFLEVCHLLLHRAGQDSLLHATCKPQCQLQSRTNPIIWASFCDTHHRRQGTWSKTSQSKMYAKPLSATDRFAQRQQGLDTGLMVCITTPRQLFEW